MAFLAPLALAAAPELGTIGSALAPKLFKFGKQFAMGIGKKSVSGLFNKVKGLVGSHHGREELLRKGGQYFRTGNKIGREVLGGLNKVGLLSNHQSQRYGHQLDRVGNTAQHAMGYAKQFNRLTM